MEAPMFQNTKYPCMLRHETEIRKFLLEHVEFDDAIQPAGRKSSGKNSRTPLKVLSSSFYQMSAQGAK